MARTQNRMDRALLRGFEKVSVPVLDALNTRQPIKSALFGSIGRFNARWITWTTGNLWQVAGIDPLRDLDAPRGVILASNHRSFFDMFVASTVLVRDTHLVQRVTYPVRSDFFYTHPMGLVLNVAMSGASMWPPVFRDDRRRQLNPTGLDQLADMLQRGSIVGFHPEGTRNKSPDQYTFLPARAGLGALVQACDSTTLVLPFFIAGLSNQAGREVRRNFARPGQRGEPVRLRFGAPVSCEVLRGSVAKGGSEAAALAISQTVMATIHDLGQQDKRLRAIDPRPA